MKKYVLSFRNVFCYLFILILIGALLYPNIIWAQGDTKKVELNEQQPTWVKRQLRAVWIPSVLNITWPSKTGLSKEEQQKEMIQLLDEAKAMGMNAVVIQIRPTADAFYPSKINPWSKYLSGKQGEDPGYDPLAFMLKEAHKRNLEFHAWFNPYRVSMDTNLDALVPEHVARQHPDWVVAYGGKLYFNPGIPEVKQHVIDSVIEVVKNYDIDAVHFDDYFYPYPVAGQEFPDEELYQKYGAGQFKNKQDWRRHNINMLVKEVGQAIKKEKPYVKFGISPFGIWRNKSSDPTGSETNGSQSYETIYADTRTWIQNEWIDYVTPQVYWNRGYPPAAYDKLVPWWANEVKDKRVHLYIGQAVYKIGTTSPPAWQDPEEMPNQLKLNMQYPEVKGSMFFSMSDLRANRLGIKDRLAQDLYKYPALVPSMPWLDDDAPPAPHIHSALRTQKGIALVWGDHPKSDAVYYVIYRFKKDEAIDFDRPEHILTTIRRSGKFSIAQFYLDTTAQPDEQYVYYVTAVDRLHNESKPSKPKEVKGKPF
ncbi:glycoside hydrolase family 10 protein [Thermoflavimicrobium dichotomicum]|uniref:Uncharacterized lipoprotein YddW, UPF0748 family n=1 Tax=Thermoflavimicrobium dichotomicum TaxID=46223 RepID=A0A1I3TBK2_9BACL|nr:Uncharacterized lipoprotein YddW, UPF0748 family [Thermoflavimicrobium dichotomicum]